MDVFLILRLILFIYPNRKQSYFTLPISFARVCEQSIVFARVFVQTSTPLSNL